MPASTTPIFPNIPYAITVSLAALTACTTRGPTATAALAAANIIQLVPASDNGRRIDKITVQAASTAIAAPTALQLVGLWLWDATTAFLIDEFTVDLVTPSTTVPNFKTEKEYTMLVLPAAFPALRLDHNHYDCSYYRPLCLGLWRRLLNALS